MAVVTDFSDGPDLHCQACGVDASCNCGAPLVPAWQKAAEYDAANPGKSTRQAGEALGLSKDAVHRARRSDVADETPDDRPTIDKPPRGELWDDQWDKRVGKDETEQPGALLNPGGARRAGRTSRWGA